MRFNIFKIDFPYIPKGDFWETKSIQHQSSYVQLQFPIGYHHQFRSNDLTADLSPAFYLVIKKMLKANFPLMFLDNAILLIVIPAFHTTIQTAS